MSLQEFEALQHVVPTSEWQAEALTTTIEAFIQDHPELQHEIDEFYTVKNSAALDKWLSRLHKLEAQRNDP